MPRSRATRALRGTLAASAATFLALVSHVTAGGAMPGWVGVVVPWVLSVAVCTVLAGRALSVVRLAVAVAASQFFFHTLFVLGMFGTSTTPAMAHDHAAMTMMPMPASVVPIVTDSSIMWVWHAVAALVTIVVIHRGEATLRRLVAVAGELRVWLDRRIRRLVVVPTLAVTPRLLTLAAPRVITSPGWHPSAIGLRGPPAFFAL